MGPPKISFRKCLFEEVSMIPKHFQVLIIGCYQGEFYINYTATTTNRMFYINYTATNTFTAIYCSSKFYVNYRAKYTLSIF